jgi:hypothetical protein
MNGSLDWERVSELFEGALAVPPEELGAWLDRECGEDATLRNELESLLRRSSDSEGFLDRLKAAVVGPLADGAIEGTAPRLPTGMRLIRMCSRCSIPVRWRAFSST